MSVIGNGASPVTEQIFRAVSALDQSRCVFGVLPSNALDETMTINEHLLKADAIDVSEFRIFTAVDDETNPLAPQHLNKDRLK